MFESPVWADKYRPLTIKDTILPRKVKNVLQNMVDTKEVPVHLLFSGGSGIGKTTAAQALVHEIGADAFKINASLKGNIDTLRTEILDFASSVSFSGGRKFVILDEADGLTKATQTALRAFMEDFSVNCGFILTANFPNNIIDALHSRSEHISFIPVAEEIPSLKQRTFKRVSAILKNEGVEFDPNVVSQIVEKNYPDFRRMLNILQGYQKGFGKIDTGILVQNDTAIDALVQAIRARNYSAVRKWIGEFSGDYDTIYRAFYDAATQYVLPESIPQLVVLIAKYRHMATSCVDLEVNTAAFAAEVMALCEFKQ